MSNMVQRNSKAADSSPTVYAKDLAVSSPERAKFAFKSGFALRHSFRCCLSAAIEVHYPVAC